MVKRMSTSISTSSESLKPISGSYSPDDCEFLLTLMEPEYTSVEEKERRIQSGRAHYSEMISFEAAPSEEYLTLFKQLTARYRARIASEVLAIADYVMEAREQPLTIVSLARAGTPLGALLKRALRDHRGVACQHYSISIIRDRGIDQAALRYILRDQARPAGGVFFVDSWTAKGVITRELNSAIADWNSAAKPEEQLASGLVVLSDIGGCAEFAATHDDYAIPSGILNATVSGLLSRSILNHHIAEGQFHGSVYYDHLKPHDHSAWFLDQVSECFSRVDPAPRAPITEASEARVARATLTERWVKDLLMSGVVRDLNHIKPGVAEATRVLLRRVPERLFVRAWDDPDVEHLLALARDRDVSVELAPQMPFKAASLIKAVTKADTLGRKP